MPDTLEILQELLEELEELYEELDRCTAELADKHAARLRCRFGCTGCCVDEVTVFEVEAEHIRRRHARLLEEGEPREPGACAFLGPEGRCRIYESRPYVCRTQGLPLRWIEELPDGELVEMRDICPENDRGLPLETLEEAECWTLGPFEERLAGLQVRLGGWDLRRVPLRNLFRRAHIEKETP